MIHNQSPPPARQFLKTALPLPEDDQLSLMFDPKGIIWSPVRRSDVAWNFEKFLVDASGKPVPYWLLVPYLI